LSSGLSSYVSGTYWGYSYGAGGPKAVESINFTLAYQKALTKKKVLRQIQRGKT